MRGGLGARGRGQLGQAGQPGSGSAQSAGDVEQVAGSRAGAEQRPAAGNGADQDNVGHGHGGFGQVAAGQRGLVGLGQGQKAVEKALEPRSSPPGDAPQLPSARAANPAKERRLRDARPWRPGRSSRAPERDGRRPQAGASRGGSGGRRSTDPSSRPVLRRGAEPAGRSRRRCPGEGRHAGADRPLRAARWRISREQGEFARLGMVPEWVCFIRTS